MAPARQPSDLDWAFVVLEAHPYGREMLARLVAAGFVPRVVIEEHSEVARIERQKFEVRLAGFPLAPSIDATLSGHDVARVLVDSHNDDACDAELAARRPELLVLGGTRILKARIFAHAREGALNSHPGLLPEVRGSASVAWAIHLDLPVGCTCHFIEAGIDTGPIAARREIPVHRGDTYPKLCHATTTLSADLMLEALTAHVAGTLAPTPQGPGGPAHKNMPDELVAQVERKLAEHRYRGYAATASTEADPDERLLTLWGEGDREAGDALVRRHFDAVFRFFRSKLERDVDDLVQRTFLACVESRAAFRKEGSFRAFLLGIARMQLLRYLQRELPRGTDPLELSAIDVAVATRRGSPSGEVAAREERDLVLDALRTLPLAVQMCLELHYWEGLRLEEVAEVVGIPVGTVKTRMHRGRAALRVRLGDDAITNRMIGSPAADDDG